MAIFKCTIRKKLISQDSVRWSNVYHMLAADLPEALGNLFDGVVPLEKAIHTADVQFYRIEAKDISTPGPSSFRADNISEIGLLGSDPSIALPLWNVARVVLNDSVGRPETKYIRCPLQEDDVSGQFLDSGLVATIQTDYADPLVALGYICNPGGSQLIVNGNVIEAIQMRQQHWSRRARPGFHRAYVPN